MVVWFHRVYLSILNLPDIVRPRRLRAGVRRAGSTLGASGGLQGGGARLGGKRVVSGEGDVLPTKLALEPSKRTRCEDVRG